MAAGGDRQLREPVRGARLPRGLHQGHPLPRLGAGQPQLTHQVTITIRNTHCKCCLLLLVIVVINRVFCLLQSVASPHYALPACCLQPACTSLLRIYYSFKRRFPKTTQSFSITEKAPTRSCLGGLSLFFLLLPIPIRSLA